MVDQDAVILNNYNLIKSECSELEKNLNNNQSEFDRGRIEKDELENEIE